MGRASAPPMPMISAASTAQDVGGDTALRATPARARAAISPSRWFHRDGQEFHPQSEARPERRRHCGQHSGNLPEIYENSSACFEDARRLHRVGDGVAVRAQLLGVSPAGEPRPDRRGVMWATSIRSASSASPPPHASRFAPMRRRCSRHLRPGRRRGTSRYRLPHATGGTSRTAARRAAARPACPLAVASGCLPGRRLRAVVCPGGAASAARSRPSTRVSRAAGRCAGREA